MTLPTDAELVTGVLSGDRDAFAAMYDRYADRLHDLCWAALRDREAAADAVRDTFVVAVRRLGRLRDPDQLWPWLESAAREVVARRGPAVEGTAPVGPGHAPAGLRREVLDHAGLQAPPRARSRRLPLAAAGAAALLLVGGLAVWAARTDPGTVPGPASGPGLATTEDADVAPATGGLSATPASAVLGAPGGSARTDDVLPPEVVAQSAADARLATRGCEGDTTTVDAELADDTGVRSALLRWTGPGHVRGEAELRREGGTWSATLGPFSAAGRAVWRITVTDVVGNIATGAPVSLAVVDCDEALTSRG